MQGWEGFKFMKKLEYVKHKVKTWNREVFGNVRLAKGHILVKIRRLDEEFIGSLKEEARGERCDLRISSLRKNFLESKS